jgi:predicted MFS family arabinose efflux permease/uncharacterized membrane protein affecting hemolysin expression
MKHTPFLVRLELFLCSLCILIAAQGFNGGLSMTSLEKLYMQSLISGFEVLGREFILQLQTAVRYGKSLEKFYGIDKNLQDIKRHLPELSDALVVLPNGRVAHSMNPDLVGRGLDETLGKGLSEAGKFVGKGASALYFKSPGSRHLVYLIKDRDERTAGRVIFSFPEDVIQKKLNAVLYANLRVLGLVTLGAAALLGLGLWFFVPLGPSGPSGPRLTILLIVVLGSAQAVYSIYNMRLFSNGYLRMTRESVTTLAGVLKTDIESLLGKGLRIDRLTRIENRFLDIIKTMPEIQDISIEDNEGRILNLADRQGPVNVRESAGKPAERRTASPDYVVTFPLEPLTKDGARKIEGQVRIQLDQQIMASRTRDILIDSLTVVMISALFVIEMYIFLRLFIGKTVRVEQEAKPAELQGPQGSPYLLGRPVAFAFLFMWALPGSFIPLFMRNLYEPMLGLSKEMVLGLPLSLELLCALFAALVAGNLTDRQGWHVPFLGGVLVAGVGAFLSGLADTGLEFILYRGLAGVGYGLAWMAIQGFIFHYSTPQTRARGIANLVAGIFSGQICGTAVGAMLAERFDYAPVFLVSGVLAVLPLLFSLLFMRRFMHRPSKSVQRPRLRWKDLRALASNGNYVAILVFSLIPFSLCQVGLLFFAAPIYLNLLGVSPSNIGRVLMIYGLSVVYIAPYISRFVDQSERKKAFIALGGLIGALGLMSLYFFSGFVAVLCAVFFLGVSGSLIGAAQSAFALKLDVIQRVGVGKAMSVQRAADKLGQMLGPIVLGAMMAAVGISKSVAIVGAIFFLATVLFMLISDESKAVAHESQSSQTYDQAPE